jgi:hypothetical protein
MNATMVASGTKAVPPYGFLDSGHSAGENPRVQDQPAPQITRSWPNSRRTSDNTAYSSRFSCIRSPMWKRVCMNSWPGHAVTVRKHPGNRARID